MWINAIFSIMLVLILAPILLGGICKEIAAIIFAGIGVCVYVVFMYILFALSRESDDVIKKVFDK
jgi:hypothetical protein